MGEKTKETVKLKGKVRFLLKDKDGNVKDEREYENLITNMGMAEVAALLLTDVASDTYDYIAVGTGTNAANVTDTTLQTELAASGLSRAAGTGTRVTVSVSNDTAQLVVTYTVTGTAAVTEAGMLNAASSGDLLCRQVFSAINVVSGDGLSVTWKITVS